MFDTMTLTKVAAGLCGAFLVFLLGNWAAETMYHVGAEGHGDGHGGEAAQAFTIEVASVETADTGDATDVPEVDFAALVAAADVASGEKVFGKCKSCHKEPGAKGTGPTLNGVVGRDIASVGDYGYSDALIGLPGDWEPAALNLFLEAPKTYAPGTKMNIAVRKLDERADLVAYLATLN